MPDQFQYLELWSKLEADGGVRLGFLGVPFSLRRKRRLDGDDAYTIAILKTHRHAGALIRRRALREVLSTDGVTLREWLIERVVRSLFEELVVVECAPPLHILLNYPVATTDLDGYITSQTGAVQMSPASVITTFLRSNTPAWVANGTVTPTALVDIGFQGDSALAGYVRLEEATGYNRSFRRNGTTQYLMDLITLGGSATPLYVRPGKNLRLLEREEPATLVTRVNTILGQPGDDGPSGLAWAFWEATVVSSPLVTLAAIHGGDGPIGFDNQNLPTSNPNLIKMDWLAWTLSDTPVLTQMSVISGDFALDTLNDNSASLAEYFFQAVTFTGDAVKVLSIIVDRGTSTQSSIVIRDTIASVNRLEATLTWTGEVPSLAMVAGTLLGSDSLGNNLYRLRFQSTSVTAANAHEVRIYPAGQTVSLTGTLFAGYCQVENASAVSDLPAVLWWERMNGSRTEVTASSASAQTITVGSVTNIAVGDWGRFTATRAGKHLSYLDHPVAAGSYGVVGGRVESAWDDTICPNKNVTGRNWATPTALPDGWTGGASVTQKTAVGEYLTAGKAAQIVLVTVAHGSVIAALPSRSWFIRARKTTWAVACWIRVISIGGGDEVALQLKVAGAVVGVPLRYRTPLNVWRQLTIEGLDLSAYAGTVQTVVPELVALDATGNVTCTLIVDSIWCGPSLSTRPVLEGSGAARIWQDVNTYLAEQNLTLPSTHRLGLLDLAAMGVAGQVEPVIGQTVEVRPEDDQIANVSTRIVEISETLNPEETEVLIAEPPARQSAKNVGPVPLVVPFFEAVHLRAAERDNQQAAMLIKAEITATSPTQVTIQLTVTDSLGGSPAITYTVFEAVWVSGSGSGPYVFNRPAVGAGVGRVVFTAQLAGRGDVTDAVDVPEAIPAATDAAMAMRILEQTTNATQVIVWIAVPDDIGGVTATINYDTGGLTVTPAGGGTLLTMASSTASPAASERIAYTITRPLFAAGTGLVQFTATAPGRGPAAGSIDIPAKERDTIDLQARATQTGTPAATTMDFTIAVVDPFPPGGATVTVTYVANPTGGVTPASGGTLTPTADFGTTGTIVYTIDRPGANSPVKRVTFTATDTANSRTPASQTVSVQPQNPPLLEVTNTPTSDTTWTITWTATGTVTVSKDGGAWTAPGSLSPALVSGTAFNRPGYGAKDESYAFKCANGGVTIAGGVLQVPAVTVLTGSTLTAERGFWNSATSVDVSFTFTGFPSGTTVTASYQAYSSTNVATGAAGSTTGLTASPWNVDPNPDAASNEKWRVIVSAVFQGQVLRVHELYGLLLL